MGHSTAQEALLMRWAQLCADPYWNDLAGKIELNGLGVIEMSPANNKHALVQSDLHLALGTQLRGGRALVECSVLTGDGVRVPDVAWASNGFLARHGAATTPFPRAPELCIEVRSPSNTNEEMAYKTELFLAAGAQEVWIVSQDGEAQFFDATGRIEKSRFPVSLPPPTP
jgi:Uma2 family endonuclease